MSLDRGEVFRSSGGRLRPQDFVPNSKPVEDRSLSRDDATIRAKEKLLMNGRVILIRFTVMGLRGPRRKVRDLEVTQ